MTEPTSDAEDFADYTDDHQKKAAVDPQQARCAHTPDVAETPHAEPPD